MLKIGIIDAENNQAHARVFAQMINEQGLWPDVRVVGMAGHAREPEEYVFDKYDLDYFYENPSDMVEKVDAAMITSRDGRLHFEVAKPFLEAGKPLFIDKPFTANAKEAKELVVLARKHNVPICGGSALRFSDSVKLLQKEAVSLGAGLSGGSMSAPLKLNSLYGGFYFYGSHLAELTLEIFGYSPKSVFAAKSEFGVTVLTQYDRYAVSGHYIEGEQEFFGVLYGNGTAFPQKIIEGYSMKKQCDDFIDMLRTGKTDFEYDKLIAPINYLDAIICSYENGKSIDIPPLA